MPNKIQYYRDAGATNYFMVTPETTVIIKLLDNKAGIEQYKDLTVNQIESYNTLFKIRSEDFKKAQNRLNAFTLNIFKQTLEQHIKYE